MFDQIAFGKKLKDYRKTKKYTQDELAAKVGVSGQAVSKWEKGECLPDVYNLKLLGQIYRVSIDSLLDMGDDGTERVIETIKIGEASFEVIEKPAAILAGKIIYAKDFTDIQGFHSAIGAVIESEKQIAYGMAVDCALPLRDINLSVNFWLKEESRAFGFVRETTSEIQPEGVGIYKMPASLYIRAYTDEATSQLIAKKQCEIWELFAYIRNFFMPAHGFVMSKNGAQEMEVFDTAKRTMGYAYMPVSRTMAIHAAADELPAQ